jgi:hypothetical protein
VTSEVSVLSKEKQQVLQLYAEGRKLFKLRNFAQAKVKFAEALKIDFEDGIFPLNIDEDVSRIVEQDLNLEPKDGPSALYYVKSKEFEQKPPPDDWDGVFEMTSK